VKIILQNLAETVELKDATEIVSNRADPSSTRLASSEATKALN